MTTTTIHTQDQNLQHRISSPGFLRSEVYPLTATPRFEDRLIQEHHRLHFLSGRASLVGKWEEEAINRLEVTFPAIIKELESKLLIGELDARFQHRITVQHDGFTCEADTLGSHGYLYIALYVS
ncbi:type IV toxin-antitoxin system YeeU family antitoxin [Aeromonas veronii]|uniref:type IV toxin-antitoxin system YeeU family antitoxin n=1 Tax=Aeromonas veronii TaxID=654 RepID=UPI00330F328F|nr:type IV toxin-antitoxin system YeeU family antitoxin [Aeromonas veronii]HDO1358676.1 type IV toxin-antitoxin system YeeU family antitoxin [Aeromonas veronii]